MPKLDVMDRKVPKVMHNQPQWRVNWLKKYPRGINSYGQAPQELRISPIHYPCVRRRSWRLFISNVKCNRPKVPKLPNPYCACTKSNSHKKLHAEGM